MINKEITVLENNKISNKSCLEGLQLIPDGVASIVLADPPYGQNIRNEKGKIGFDCEWNTEEEYLEWCSEWFKESKRILKDDGILLVWGVAPIINELSHILNYELEMKFYTQIIWHISDGLRPTHRYFYSNHQVLIGFSKSDKLDFNTFNNHNVLYNHFTEVAQSYSGQKNMGTVWKHCKISKNHKEGTPHPTQKPLELSRRIIQATTNVNDLVVVPFCGSGTECLAAKELERDYISFEIDQEFYKICKERLTKTS